MVINCSMGKSLTKEDTIIRDGNLASVVISQLIQDGYKNFLVVQAAGNDSVNASENGIFTSIT